MRKEPVKIVLADLLKSQHFPKDYLIKAQWDRLKALLDHAYNNTPYYRTAFKKMDLSPKDIKSMDDFTKLPILTKAEVQKGYKELKCKTGSIRPYTLASTSGSSGIPLKILRDNESWAYLHANIFRGLSWYGVDVGAPYAMVGGIGSGIKSMCIGIVKDTIHNRIHLYAADMNRRKCIEFLYRIKNFKAQYIYGYPSAIFDLACIAKEECIKFNTGVLQLVLSHGEELEDYQREKINNVFSTPVVNTYGCAEVGLMGFQCSKGQFHIPIESILLEVINGSTVATDLYSFSFPMIRYDIGDSLELINDKCTCGISLPLFKNIKGKVRQIIELGNGRRIHTVFFNSLFKDLNHRGAPIRGYQIVRVKGDSFVAKIVTAKNMEEKFSNFILHKFNKQFGEGCSIDIKFVDKIKRSEAGKYRAYYEERSD